ncbi:MAG: DNRLRE domain-containing protein [Clostridium sp.]
MTCLKSKYMKDTFVISNLPYKKYHLSSLLLIGNLKREDELKSAKAIMKFNLDSIKALKVKRATLKISVRKNQPYTNIKNTKFKLGINTEYIYISDACYKSAPEYISSQEEFIVDKLDIGRYIEINITDIINKWLSKEVVNNGLTIYSDDDLDGHIIHFSSTESSKPPILEYEL